MAGVNPSDYRSLVRADSSIRSSTRVLRIDDTHDNTPPITEPTLQKTVVETKRDVVIVQPPPPKPSKPPPVQPEKITPTVNVRKSIRSPDSGPSSRLRPVQNVISAVNTLKSGTGQSNTSRIISRILHPSKEKSNNPTNNDSSTDNTRIEELEKTIKSLEEKLESKHDALAEMWKIRDEMEVMKQTIQKQTRSTTNHGDEKKTQDKTIEIDKIIGEVKNITDKTSKETITKIHTLDEKISLVDKKTNTRQTTIEKAVESLAKQVTTVEKKEAVVETRIGVVESKIAGEIKRIRDHSNGISKKVEALGNNVTNNNETYKKDITRLESKIDTTTTRTETITLLENEIGKLKSQQESLQKELNEYKTTEKDESSKVVILPEGPKIDEVKLRKDLTEDVSSKIQSAIQKVQTERADREREIIKEQKEIRDLISKTELKLMTEIKKTPTSVAKPDSKETPSRAPEDAKLQERIRVMETELKILREKVGDVHTERRSRSNPRSLPHSARELDSHRLAEFPLFVAELYNEQVIIGDSGLQPLVVPKHWEIVTDTDKGFNSDGIYHVPFPGCYDVNVIFKTISTSVTAQIYVEHLGADGKIVKSYALDQGALVNESTGTVKLMNMNGGEGIRLRIQTRFNMALVERQVVEETLDDGTKHEHHVVYNMVQITYSPVRGFCEC